MKGFKNAIFRLCVGAKRVAFGWLLFGALGGVAVAADAGDVFNHLYQQAGNPGYSTLGPASSGRALVVSGATVASDGSASVKLVRAATMINPSGVGVQVLYKSAFQAGAVAAGVVGAIKMVSPLGTALVAGKVLYDIAKELSFDFGANYPDGSPQVLKVAEASPICAPVVAPYSYPGDGWNPSWGCKKMVSGVFYWGWVKSTCYYDTSCPTEFLAVEQALSGYIGNSSTPSSLDELRDAIANKSGWPAASKIGPAIIEAARVTGKSPDEIPANNPDGSPNPSPDAPTVTGPSSSSGGEPKVSTTSKPDGSTETTTSTTTHHHTYEGAKITTSTTNNSSVQSCTGAGSCVTTTTVSTSKPLPEAQTDCEKNPDAIGCKTLDDVPTDEIPKAEKEVSWAEESLGLGGGSCPGPWSFATSNGNYSLDIAQYCDTLITYVKPVVIVMALLAAFFIVAPIRTGV